MEGISLKRLWRKSNTCKATRLRRSSVRDSNSAYTVSHTLNNACIFSNNINCCVCTFQKPCNDSLDQNSYTQLAHYTHTHTLGLGTLALYKYPATYNTTKFDQRYWNAGKATGEGVMLQHHTDWSNGIPSTSRPTGKMCYFLREGHTPTHTTHTHYTPGRVWRRFSLTASFLSFLRLQTSWGRALTLLPYAYSSSSQWSCIVDTHTESTYLIIWMWWAYLFNGGRDFRKLNGERDHNKVKG